MSNPVLRLFCDTNLLIQCKTLEELDWSMWKDHDVHVIVTQPVLGEIDQLKVKGSPRVARRARKVNSMFGEMLPTGRKTIRDSGPRVTLHVEPEHRHEPDLANQLDYSKADDRLVGTVYRFAHEQPGEDARLLTHDTTPLYTAQRFDVEVVRIPDGWLLPPENDERQKKIAALQRENARLRQSEPSFDIRFLGSSGSEVERFEAAVSLYDPLTKDEVKRLMERLRSQHTVKTDFGPPKIARGTTDARTIQDLNRSLRASATGEYYSPPSDKAIAKYRDQAYPDWLSHCEELLFVLHHELQQRQPVLSFCYRVANTGTRPATDALVTVEASRHFTIMPERDDIDSEPVQLPSPPTPPRGTWQSAFDLGSFDPFRQLGLGAANPVPWSGHDLVEALQQPDPNTFYYKPDRPSVPGDSFSLSCQQWRHATDIENFVGEIHVPSGSTDVAGALTLRIHAENLARPVKKTIGVHINVHPVSSYSAAENLIHSLGNRNNP